MLSPARSLLTRRIPFPFLRTIRSLQSSARLNFVDPFPLPLSDPALAAAASRSPLPYDHNNVDDEAMPKPIERKGETEERMRARLIYQTRKRGTLESDLLLSTFARDMLGEMSVEEMREFDQLLDEPDWDIYYWSIGKKEPPAKWKHTSLLAKLTLHAKNEGKVVRMMPALETLESQKS